MGHGQKARPLFSLHTLYEGLSITLEWSIIGTPRLGKPHRVACFLKVSLEQSLDFIAAKNSVPSSPTCCTHGKCHSVQVLALPSSKLPVLPLRELHILRKTLSGSCPPQTTSVLSTPQSLRLPSFPPPSSCREAHPSRFMVGPPPAALISFW